MAFSSTGCRLLSTKPLLIVLLLLTSALAWSQVNDGEVRFKITDPSGAAVRASVELSCTGNGYDKSFFTDASGSLTVRRMPYGIYQLQIEKTGFSPLSKTIEVDSALPIDQNIRLSLASVVTRVKVQGTDHTLIDPYSSASVMQIGSQQIQQRLSSLPGRSMQDLVITQPGWLYE